MKEIWKKIPGLSDNYEASNLGRIKSLCYRGGKIPQILSTEKRDNDGYARINIQINGVRKTYGVHRLVAIAFFGDNKDLVVNHKNEIKDDNKIENLELVTNTYNNVYNDKMKKIGVKLLNKKGAKPVLQIVINSQVVIYPSVMEAYRTTGIHPSNIRACCKGRIHTAGGYVWYYA